MEDHQYHNHLLQPLYPQQCLCFSYAATGTSQTTSYPNCTTGCPISMTKPSTIIKLVSLQTWICRKIRWRCESMSSWDNDWMDTHVFSGGIKVQRFCSTLVGEARLWYESLRHIALEWNGLQIQLRLQYSKIGNTREQLFHEWR